MYKANQVLVSWNITVMSNLQTKTISCQSGNIFQCISRIPIINRRQAISIQHKYNFLNYRIVAWCKDIPFDNGALSLRPALSYRKLITNFVGNGTVASYALWHQSPMVAEFVWGRDGAFARIDKIVVAIRIEIAAHTTDSALSRKSNQRLMQRKSIGTGSALYISRQVKTSSSKRRK